MTLPDAPEAAAESFHTDQVLTIAGGHFVHDTYSAFIAPLLPLIQEKLSLSYGLAGSLAMFLQLPGLLNPIIGYLADRMSVRYFVIFAPAVTATLMSAMGLTPNYLSLALLILLAGVSVSAFHAPAPAMIANVSAQRVGAGMGIYMAGVELGRTLGPLIIAGSVAWLGLEGLWRLMFVGWFVSGFLFFRLRHVKVASRIKKGLDLAKVWRVFSVLAWMLMTRAFFLGAITTFLPTYMNDVVRANFWIAAGALTILEAAGVAGALLAGAMSDRYGRRGILLLLLVSAPLLLLLFVVSPSWLYVPLLLVLGFTGLATAPIMLAIVQDEFSNDRALANGIFLALNFVILGLGIYLTGVMADWLGLRMAFLMTAVIALLAIPAIFFLPDSAS
jgi:FSR family fosmidomycin resistance protein-like MFS transporter